MSHVMEPISHNGFYLFMPNFAKISIFTRRIYYYLSEQNQNVRAHLSVEMFEYYVIALLWARLLNIKHLNPFQNLTQKEYAYRAFFNTYFYVPKVIRKLFSYIGNVVLEPTTSQMLYLADHALPICEAGGKGGYHAECITAENHNLFEEVPSLGVIGDSLMALADIEATRGLREPYHPFLPSDSLAASPTKLIGYYGSVTGTEEWFRFLASIAISPQNFPESVPSTRFNVHIIQHVSTVLRTSGIRGMRKICILKMDILGSQLQLVEMYPAPSDTSMLYNDYFNPQSISWTEVPTIPGYFYHYDGVALNKANVTGFRLFKEALFGSHANWCCVRAKQTTNVFDIPAKWIANRNARRVYFTFCTPVFLEDMSWATEVMRSAVESNSDDDDEDRTGEEYTIITNGCANHLQCPGPIRAG